MNNPHTLDAWQSAVDQAERAIEAGLHDRWGLLNVNYERCEDILAAGRSVGITPTPMCIPTPRHDLAALVELR